MTLPWNNLHDLRLLLLYPRLAPQEDPDKIAVIGGAQRIIYELATYFRSQGARVFLASDDRADSLIIQNLTSQGIQHLPTLFLSKTPGKFLRTYWQLRQQISRERINLIDSHHRWTTLFGFLLAKSSPDPAFVHHAHSVFKNRLIFKRFIGENIIAVSDGVKKNLVETFRVTPQKVRTIYNGVTMKKASAEDLINLRTALGLSQQDRVISVIGRISRLKGHEYLIKALSKVREEIPQVKVLFVGGQDFREPGLKETLLRQAAELKVQDSICFLGHRDDVAACIGISEFVILPSIQEGLPLILAECQMLGKAVVATNVGGIPEIVRHDLTGLIVEPRDVEGLAQAVTGLLSHPERARQMGEESKKFTQKFSFEGMLEQHSQYYLSLLANQTSSAY